MIEGIWPWVAFNALVLALLALDLGVFHRHAHVVSFKEAAIWSVVWVLIACTFGVGLGWFHPRGQQASLEFFTGYLIEKSLSVDNIFVFVLIFTAFAVPAAYQHRVLFWGILGALLMRGFFIAIGTWLLKEFHWVIYVFGAFLIVTGIKMAIQKERKMQVESNGVVRFARRLLPVTESYHKDKFFVRQNGKIWGTPLFIVLILIETTDLIFAVDSIPAIFAVTKDPFLVYTSNVFAILGLRSLYFLLAGVVDRFHLLKLGLAIVLVFVGVKMLLVETAYTVPTSLSLVVIGVVIGGSIVLSLVFPKKGIHATDASADRDGREIPVAAKSKDGIVAPQPPYRSLVAATDFSPCSAVAISQAIRIGALSGAPVRVVHVIDTVVVIEMESAFVEYQQTIRDKLVEEAERTWQAFSAELPGAAELPVTIKINNRIVGIVNHVRDSGADLLVMGAFGDRCPDVGFGTLATACIRNSATDVLLVRDSQRGPFRIILAAVDFSESSALALARAAVVAAQDNAELHVVHVAPNTKSFPRLPAEASIGTEDRLVRYRESLEGRLAAFVAPLIAAHQGLSVQATCVDEKGHRSGIVAHAAVVGADLIVLGTRGRSNLRDVLLGSTAERTLAESPCSVLAVKPRSSATD